MSLVCIYCGKPCDFWCRDCGENHLVTEQEFDEYHGNEPEEDEASAYQREQIETARSLESMRD